MYSSTSYTSTGIRTPSNTLRAPSLAAAVKAPPPIIVTDGADLYSSAKSSISSDVHLKLCSIHFGTNEMSNSLPANPAAYKYNIAIVEVNPFVLAPTSSSPVHVSKIASALFPPGLSGSAVTITVLAPYSLPFSKQCIVPILRAVCEIPKISVFSSSR